MLVGEPPQTRHFGTRQRKLHSVRFGTFCPKAHPVPLRLLSPHSPLRWACAGTPDPKALAAELPLTGLFLIFPSLGDVTQMIDITLDGDKLPHGFLRGTVLRGQGLFSRYQFPPLLFQLFHFG